VNTADALIKIIDPEGHVELIWRPEDVPVALVTKELMESVVAKHNFLIDLREKVNNLPDAHRSKQKMGGPGYGKFRGDGSIWRSDVLALLGGTP
jgi:hypothetical protein